MKYQTAMLQDRIEMRKFLDLIKREKVTRYLEIGCKHGGSLWFIGSELPPRSRIVAVDLPHGDRSFKESQPHLEACVDHLLRLGHEAYLLIGDSTDPQVIADVTKLGPFDLVFIDANHTEPYVWADWKAYGELGRMIAFHDIGWIARPEPSKKMPIEVPRVWAEIKQYHRHVEIRNCPRDNGIGVLWRE
jgi:predicted O-methyltransferase YrrM